MVSILYPKKIILKVKIKFNYLLRMMRNSKGLFKSRINYFISSKNNKIDFNQISNLAIIHPNKYKRWRDNNYMD
jgi:hypothetical protein